MVRSCNSCYRFKSQFCNTDYWGHHGANTLAKKLSTLGALPVITTATEVYNLPSVEGIAEKLNCDILNKDSTKEVNCALLEMDMEVLEIIGPKILIVDSSVSVLKRKYR